jgi:hypothetical protein
VSGADLRLRWPCGQDSGPAEGGCGRPVPAHQTRPDRRRPHRSRRRIRRLLFPLRAHKVVGTDIFHAAALLYVAGFGHFIAGNVDIGAVGWLLIGSIPGILIGSQLSLSVPDRLLRGALATVLGLSGLRLLNVPGTTTAIVIVLACGMYAAHLHRTPELAAAASTKAATRANLR